MTLPKKFLVLVCDLVIAALILGSIWGVNYLIPQKGVRAQVMSGTAYGETAETDGSTGKKQSDKSIASQSDGSALKGAGSKLFIFPGAGTWPGQAQANQAQTDQAQAGQGQAEEGVESDAAIQEAEKTQQTLTDMMAGTLKTTKVSLDPQNWHQKFADQFTDHVVATENSYTSPDLAIHLSYNSYDSSRLDSTSQGDHTRYGTNISYVLADIYVGDITCFQTGFAQDTYGVGFSEKLSDMSARLGAVLAVNGDSYSNSRHKDNGTIIRNGVIYRAQPTDMETCVLNWDGTMKIYGPEEIDTQQLIDSGAYQSWIFGPSLLDENGKAKSSFLTWNYIRESHPRTAIGYYEPGHYCLLVVDGRQSTTRGMFLEEMAALFEQLGCKAAYNLDGGHCSVMTFQDRTASHPYRPDHKISDGIFISEGIQKKI